MSVDRQKAMNSSFQIFLKKTLLRRKNLLKNIKNLLTKQGNCQRSNGIFRTCLLGLDNVWFGFV